MSTEMFESLASCFAFRYSASLNMTVNVSGVENDVAPAANCDFSVASFFVNNG